MPRQKVQQKQKYKSVVITGCHGFIGKRLLAYFEHSKKWPNVVAVDRIKPEIPLQKTRFYKLDFTDTLADVALAEILKKERCDLFVHAALPISPLRDEAQAHEIIAIGSFYVFNACNEAGVKKIVMTSTADVYGALAENPHFLTENMPLHGHQLSRFLADKIDAERQALKFQHRHPEAIVSILRPATILGPTIESFKTRYLIRPVVMTMFGYDPLLQFVHEDDVHKACVTLIEKDHRGVFNLGADGVMPLSRVIAMTGNVNVSLAQVGFRSLAQLLWYADISPAPASFTDFLRYPCVVDSAKIKKELRFKFKYTTKETLLDFVKSRKLSQSKTEAQHASV